MYRRPPRIYTDLKNIENYIEGTDVYNSSLLYYLSQPGLETFKYTVKDPYRTDLIAEDAYGDIKYEAFVLFQIKIPISALTRGLTIELLKKEVIDDILRNKIDY